MATISVATGARLLGIHPKTLHHWLAEAKVPLAPHPTDARIKCVREDHLQEVARRHSRPLPELPSASLLNACSAPGSRAEPAQLASTNEAGPTHSVASSASEVDLIQRLSCLETRMVTVQEHLAQLALALLHERERTVEQRLLALEALVHPLVAGRQLADPHEQEARPEPARVSHPGHQPLPVEQRARSRMPALIEYGAQGAYVIISSQEGELHLTPDSADWFAWLASISSFRFVGQQDYRQLLGTTDHLTIQRLEQAAAAIQSQLSSL